MEADLEKTQAPPERYDGREYNRMRRELDKAAHDAMQCAGNEAPSRPMTESEKLNELFRYHAPMAHQIPKYNAINQAAKNFAEIILQNCPPSADRSDAIRKIREARMVANASIALDGLSL